MIQYTNQWLLSLKEGIKTIKYWNYRLNEHGVQLTNRFSEFIYRLLFSDRLLIWVDLIRLTIQIEIKKIWFQEYHCTNVFSKHLPRINHLVEALLITFLTSILLKFMNSLGWLFRFALLRKWWYMSITKSSKFTESSLSPFPVHKCTKWPGQSTSKIFWSPCDFIFSEIDC